MKNRTLNVRELQERLELYREHVGNYWRELDEFKPELMLCGPLTWALCMMYQFKRDVPYMMCGLQRNLPTTHFAPFGLPWLPIWTGLNWSIWRMVFKDFHKSMSVKQVLTEKAVGEDMEWSLDPSWYMDCCMDVDNCALSPSIFGTSVNFSKRAPDWPRSSTLTGWWTMEEAEQVRQSRRGSAYFGDGKYQELEDFVAAGEPPVYLGWGSMIAKSREHMSGMAVRALVRAGKRGVVLGGWAELTLECLRAERDRPELEAYCDESVLFAKSAPHIWLSFDL